MAAGPGDIGAFSTNCRQRNVYCGFFREGDGSQRISQCCGIIVFQQFTPPDSNAFFIYCSKGWYKLAVVFVVLPRRYPFEGATAVEIQAHSVISFVVPFTGHVAADDIIIFQRNISRHLGFTIDVGTVVNQFEGTKQIGLIGNIIAFNRHITVRCYDQPAIFINEHFVDTHIMKFTRTREAGMEDNKVFTGFFIIIG